MAKLTGKATVKTTSTTSAKAAPKATKAAPKTAPKATKAAPKAEVKTVSKMEQARAIVREAYANEASTNPRKDAIARMMLPEDQGGLGFKNTTAATYHGHVISHFLKQEQAEAMAKAEAGKPVWSAFKVNPQGIVTSAGVFLSKKSAMAFNSEFRHDGVVKGVQEVNKPVLAKAA